MLALITSESEHRDTAYWSRSGFLISIETRSHGRVRLAKTGHTGAQELVRVDESVITAA